MINSFSYRLLENLEQLVYVWDCLKVEGVLSQWNDVGCAIISPAFIFDRELCIVYCNYLLLSFIFASSEGYFGEGIYSFDAFVCKHYSSLGLIKAS